MTYSVKRFPSPYLDHCAAWEPSECLHIAYKVAHSEVKTTGKLECNVSVTFTP